MKPAWQPQPAPPAQTSPGIMEGRNGRPPGSGNGATPPAKGAVPLPNAGAVTVPKPPALAPAAPVTYAFKVASPVYPEIAQGRPTFNPVTGEWILPRG